MGVPKVMGLGVTADSLSENNVIYSNLPCPKVDKNQDTGCQSFCYNLITDIAAQNCGY